MASLNDDVKRFIVQSLACYDTPQQVVDAVKEEFDIKITRQQAQTYDPDKQLGKKLSAKWVAVFRETRKKFLEDVSSIPISNQTFRLRSLNRMLARVERQGNVAAAAQLLEQAAKELGGAYTNRQKLDLGGKVEVRRGIQDLSDDELLGIATGGGSGAVDKA